MTFLGAAALWRSRSQFRVDLLPNQMAGRRSGQVLEIVLSLLSLAFFLVFTYEGVVFTLRSPVPSPILGLPKTYWYMSMPIAGIIILVYTVRDLWQLIRGRTILASEAVAEHHS
jgi:TRAP-type C4-dicarboxylate transport system permease small subunit